MSRHMAHLLMLIAALIWGTTFIAQINKSIALAVVRGGKEMMGKKLFIPMEGRSIKVTIVNSVFLIRRIKD